MNQNEWFNLQMSSGAHICCFIFKDILDKSEWGFGCLGAVNVLRIACSDVSDIIIHELYFYNFG